MSGTIDNFTGYMLGNNLHQVEPGQKWWPVDTSVFVCLNIDAARDILEETQRFAHSTVWTTIYRVKAPRINYESIDGKLLWTRDASKLIVDAPVFYKDVPHVSEDVLLHRARVIMPAYARLIKSLNRREK